MKMINLNNIFFNNSWEWSVRCSMDGQSVEIWDKSFNQFLFSIGEEKLLQKKNYNTDYIYLNHRIDKYFYKLSDGFVLTPEPLGSYSSYNNHRIDESYYCRGVIFSDIDLDENILILVSKCPNNFKKIPNDYRTEELLYSKSSTFHWYKRPQNDEPIENEIVIGFFNLQTGELINRIFLQSCDGSTFYTTCELSKLRKELLLFSAEHTFLINYKTGLLINLFEGENVNFINQELIGHWDWMGYDSFFGGNEIIDNNGKKINAISLNQFEDGSNGNFWINEVRIYENNIYFLGRYPSDLNNNRIFKIQINKWDKHEASELTFNEAEKILNISSDGLMTYTVTDGVIKINNYDFSIIQFHHQSSFPLPKVNPSVEKPLNSFYFIDIHTKSSIKLADSTFLTERTEIGELLYQYKYCFNKSVEESLSKRVYNFIEEKKLTFDVLIPIPPSNIQRLYQPVFELALSLESRGIKVDMDYVIKTKNTPPIKEINDEMVRKEMMKDLFELKDKRYMNKTVLLFDDLYRSGETLNSLAKVLIEKGEVKSVIALTITKTRTHK